jgi:hypothetical protein
MNMNRATGDESQAEFASGGLEKAVTAVTVLEMI